jgi:hypothetical protein
MYRRQKEWSGRDVFFHDYHATWRNELSVGVRMGRQGQNDWHWLTWSSRLRGARHNVHCIVKVAHRWSREEPYATKVHCQVREVEVIVCIDSKTIKWYNLVFVSIIDTRKMGLPVCTVINNRLVEIAPLLMVSIVFNSRKVKIKTYLDEDRQKSWSRLR